jgi:hypothetical protein
MDMHHGPEVRQHLLGAASAGVVFQKIPGLTADEFHVVEGHRAAANPFVAVAEVDVIEFGHGYFISVVRKAAVWLRRVGGGC